ISQPGISGATKAKLPAVSSQPCEASTRRPPGSPHTCAARLRPGNWNRRSLGTGSAEPLLSPALVLVEWGAAEALRDELLQSLLLLVQARARHQQHAIARRQTRDDFAEFQVGETGLHRNGNRLSALLQHDPVVAAEQVARVFRNRFRGCGPTRAAAEHEPAAAGEAARRTTAAESAATAAAASLAAT